jgi:glycosyltransferase involved in cell wall biosynthesis
VSQSLIKVLHFRQSSNIWGPEKWILDLCWNLLPYGFSGEIAIMYRRSRGEPAEHPLQAAARAQMTPITQLDGRPAALRQSIRWLRDKLRGEEFSILHAHEYKTNLLAALAANGIRRRPPVLVATVRHTEPGCQMGLFQGLDSLVLHRFDRLTVPSRGALEELKHWPKLLSKAHVIRHAVDCASLARDGPVAGLPESTGGPVVSIIGRLQAVKGHQVFLESARRVLLKKPDARFWVVGEGELRGELEAVTSRLGLAGAVSFLGYRNDIPNVMASSDVIACASSYESGPRCVLEALSLGRPVVATSVGGIPEIISDGETGMLVPPGDPEALAAAIARLLADRELACSLGTAGRKLIEERYTGEAQASAMAAFYREALACK